MSVTNHLTLSEHLWIHLLRQKDKKCRYDKHNVHNKDSWSGITLDSLVGWSKYIKSFKSSQYRSPDLTLWHSPKLSCMNKHMRLTEYPGVVLFWSTTRGRAYFIFVSLKPLLAFFSIRNSLGIYLLFVCWGLLVAMRESVSFPVAAAWNKSSGWDFPRDSWKGGKVPVGQSLSLAWLALCLKVLSQKENTVMLPYVMVITERYHSAGPGVLTHLIVRLVRGGLRNQAGVPQQFQFCWRGIRGRLFVFATWNIHILISHPSAVTSITVILS